MPTGGIPDSVSLQPVLSKTYPSPPTATAVKSNNNTEIIELAGRLGGSNETDHAIAPLQSNTNAHRLKARLQFASCCYTMFLQGWNDGSTGPLLPRIQEVYHIGFAVVSLVFVFACVGFVSGAALNLMLSNKLGFGKIVILGSVLQIVAYCLEAAALPFPGFVLGYLINGIGMALQDAQVNGYIASLKDNAEAKMGFAHAVYGAGAFAAPLVATQFSQLNRWSFHYLVSLGISISNAIILIFVFRFKTQNECFAQFGQAPEEQGTSQDSQFRQIFSLKAVHLLAIFALVYVGIEVTIGGWIVTFIIDVRHGGPSSGYISAGFFGGLMIGRVALLWVNTKIGERRALFLYAILAIGLEIAIWFIPSLIGGAVIVSVVGVLLGPMYPIAMNESSRILPRWLLTGSIGWIAGFGQAGSALFPFITGSLAQKFGIKSLQPLLVAMMSFMIGLWWLVPARPRRIE